MLHQKSISGNTNTAGIRPITNVPTLENIRALRNVYSDVAGRLENQNGNWWPYQIIANALGTIANSGVVLDEDIESFTNAWERARDENLSWRIVGGGLTGGGRRLLKTHATVYVGGAKREDLESYQKMLDKKPEKNFTPGSEPGSRLQHGKPAYGYPLGDTPAPSFESYRDFMTSQNTEQKVKKDKEIKRKTAEREDRGYAPAPAPAASAAEPRQKSAFGIMMPGKQSLYINTKKKK
jgi:hypothetical protein